MYQKGFFTYFRILYLRKSFSKKIYNLKWHLPEWPFYRNVIFPNNYFPENSNFPERYRADSLSWVIGMTDSCQKPEISFRWFVNDQSSFVGKTELINVAEIDNNFTFLWSLGYLVN